LNEHDAPDYDYLKIPGCAELCPVADFGKLVRSKLVAADKG
jgi:hypothetical protein